MQGQTVLIPSPSGINEQRLDAVNTLSSTAVQPVQSGYYLTSPVEGTPYTPVSYTHLDVYKRQMQAYDPEQAKTLLKEAGYDETNPLKIKYKYSSSFIHADVAQILEAMWKTIGIDCELEVVESGVFYNQIDNGDFELSRYGYTASDDPSQFLTLWTIGQQVVPAVEDPAYDQMIQEACLLYTSTSLPEENNHSCDTGASALYEAILQMGREFPGLSASDNDKRYGG